MVCKAVSGSTSLTENWAHPRPKVLSWLAAPRPQAPPPRGSLTHTRPLQARNPRDRCPIQDDDTPRMNLLEMSGKSDAHMQITSTNRTTTTTNNNNSRHTVSNVRQSLF